MLEKLLSLFCGIGLVALLVIAGFGTANTKKQEVKAATETTIATTESKSKSVEKDTTENMKESTSENSGATTAEKSEANTEEVFSNGNTKDTINMNTVTDFEVDGNTLIIYTNDGSAYEWERQARQMDNTFMQAITGKEIRENMNRISMRRALFSPH